MSKILSSINHAIEFLKDEKPDKKRAIISLDSVCEELDEAGQYREAGIISIFRQKLNDVPTPKEIQKIIHDLEEMYKKLAPMEDDHGTRKNPILAAPPVIPAFEPEEEDEGIVQRTSIPKIAPRLGLTPAPDLPLEPGDDSEIFVRADTVMPTRPPTPHSFKVPGAIRSTTVSTDTDKSGMQRVSVPDTNGPAAVTFSMPAPGLQVGVPAAVRPATTSRVAATPRVAPTPALHVQAPSLAVPKIAMPSPKPKDGDITQEGRSQANDLIMQTAIDFDANSAEKLIPDLKKCARLFTKQRRNGLAEALEVIIGSLKEDDDVNIIAIKEELRILAHDANGISAPINFGAPPAEDSENHPPGFDQGDKKLLTNTGVTLNLRPIANNEPAEVAEDDEEIVDDEDVSVAPTFLERAGEPLVAMRAFLVDQLDRFNNWRKPAASLEDLDDTDTVIFLNKDSKARGSNGLTQEKLADLSPRKNWSQRYEQIVDWLAENLDSTRWQNTLPLKSMAAITVIVLALSTTLVAYLYFVGQKDSIEIASATLKPEVTPELEPVVADVTPEPESTVKVKPEPVVKQTVEPEPEPKPIAEAKPEPAVEPIVEQTPEPEPESKLEKISWFAQNFDFNFEWPKFNIVSYWSNSSKPTKVTTEPTQAVPIATAALSCAHEVMDIVGRNSTGYTIIQAGNNAWDARIFNVKRGNNGDCEFASGSNAGQQVPLTCFDNPTIGKRAKSAKCPAREFRWKI